MPEVRLSIGSMHCRHCVREVTGWLRDVVGVETITADAKTGTVVLGGTMAVDDVLAVFTGSDYTPQVLPDRVGQEAPGAHRQSPADERATPPPVTPST